VVFSYFDGMLRYFELGGRSTRRQYWLFTLFSMLAVGGAVWLDVVTGGIDFEARRLGFFTLFAGIIHVVPGLTVTVRRLHDSGRSGFWYFIGWVPFGGLVLLVFMFLGPNAEADKYGDDPRLGRSGPAPRGRALTRSQQIVARLDGRRDAGRFGGVSA
jgi:uncharacterized membrane protein YhaH (DUF805 family)